MKIMSADYLLPLGAGFLLVFIPGLIVMNHLKSTLTVGIFQTSISTASEISTSANIKVSGIHSVVEEAFSAQPYSFASIDTQKFEGCGCPVCCSAV